MAFDSKTFLPARLLDRVTELRVTEPDYALEAASRRRRRKTLTTDGKLNILAADHPARRVTAVGENRLAMCDRGDYLARIVRVLESGMVDGVMATMDVLEDLLVLAELLKSFGGRELLDEKLLIASLNRGGLAGTAWEMDDPLTGATPAACKGWAFDGAKLLLRLCDDDAGSLKTLAACAGLISQTNALGLPMFLEPLPVAKTEKGFKVLKEKDALARTVGVASALGDCSRYLWLKLPYCDGYEAVARATTLPVLLLGGESAGDVTPFLHEVYSGLRAGSNVRGALVGRNVLYPGEQDPLAAADAVGGIIHRGWTVEQAAGGR